MNSNATQTVPLLVRVSSAIAKLRPAFRIKIEVPEGYQDENGFHYGKRPVVKQITWPPTE